MINKSQEQMLLITAHYIMTRTGNYIADSNTISPETIEPQYPDYKVRNRIRNATTNMMYDSNDFYVEENGVFDVWAEPIYNGYGERTDKVEIELVGISPDGIAHLVHEGFIPAKFASVLEHGLGEPLDRKDPEGFAEWLATEWKSPLGFVYGVEDGLSTERKAAKTTHWVTQIEYTPAEAAMEIARVESGALLNRSKAAYKAHITRRTVGA